MNRTFLEMVLAAILCIAAEGIVRADDDGEGHGYSENEFVPDASDDHEMNHHPEFKLRVKEQARIEVPTVVNFQVDDVAQDTPQSGHAPILVHNVVLTTGHHLLIQIGAASDTFTDALGNPSYAASKVSWTHDGVTNGTGISGHLGAANQFSSILSCNRGTLCKTEQLTFTLGADPTQSVAGWHTLVGIYRASAIF